MIFDDIAQKIFYYGNKIFVWCYKSLDKISQERVYYWNEAINWPWSSLNIQEAGVYKTFPFFSLVWLCMRGKVAFK